MKNEIQKMQEQIKELETELFSKKKELILLKAALNKAESEKYHLVDFVGKQYTFDKPYKWTHPQKEIFSDVAPKRFDYLQFNGTYTGKELNVIYEYSNLEDLLKFKDDSTYVTFVIPEEDFDKKFQNEVIPLGSIHELLSFEI